MSYGWKSAVVLKLSADNLPLPCSRHSLTFSVLPLYLVVHGLFHQTSHGLWKGNILFNHALNTFYLQLYGIRHMVNDHSDRERGNLLPPHMVLFSISSKGSFTDRIPHAFFYTSCGALAGTRNSPMGPPWRIDLTTHHTMSERSYHRAKSRSGLWKGK